MGRWIDKLERKIGRFAIPNLMRYIIVLYVLGLILHWTAPEVYYYYFALDASAILRGQIWRVFTFLLVSPSTDPIFFIFTLYLYYILGSTLEKVWGAFRFNLYYFTGVFGTVLGAVIIYLVTGQVYLLDTFYINMSLFLAFATIIPDMQMLLFFIIPIKMKWLGYAYGLMIVYEFAISLIRGNYEICIAIALAMINFIFYFFAFMRDRHSPYQYIRRHQFERNMRKGQQGRTGQAGASYTGPSYTGGTPSGHGAKKIVPRHRCAVCGRTELDDDTLEFRYCSKCNGNYEYCNEHLFTHTHVQ